MVSFKDRGTPLVTKIKIKNLGKYELKLYNKEQSYYKLVLVHLSSKFKLSAKF